MPLVRTLVAALAAAGSLVGCGAGDTETVVRTATETETRMETETDTRTETVAGPAAGLPRAVAETHTALLEAAEARNYEALRPLIPAQFSYTFGLPNEGGPIPYWVVIEEDGGESPIGMLRRILRMPYTLVRGTYIWPFAYDRQPEDLTAHERNLLGDLADDFGAASGYLGWRTGIAPDGTWRFFIAGD